ncbi:MAG: DNA-binding transcriptional regulator Fis [Gammaproteobacteria bacterium]|nr:DNA-binding transcriptional regulator Fis [Gammaproteobacteria bacterium]
MNLQTTEMIQTTTRMSDNSHETDHATLTDTVKKMLITYFDQLDGAEPSEIYSMVLKQVEAPLLEVVMQQVDGNQTKAAACLGLNRGTLRKKLRLYGLDNN